ncbi:hypothetical protein WICMUC_002628 [Wickerhamomyces mucosus]|uniref:UBX domain-containing protein 1 n=1 Tax=Wickerhamomyces mucosus TaxID=1378264 RepID=A0A9P8PQK8_9ASCO|nr:hypothetical protein WICMUC_002628 [Wickerhamomyces mucosus]
MSNQLLIDQFVNLTQVPEAVASTILERNNWDIEDAINDFYNGPTHSNVTSDHDPSSSQGPFPAPSSSIGQQNQQSTPSTNKQKNPTSKFKSFQELVNQEDDEDEQQNFFAGGARGSGLQVENPDNDSNRSTNNLVQDLLRKAEAGGGHPDRINDDDAQEAEKKNYFEGSGFKLGDTNTPSYQVGISSSNRPKKLEKAIREITFWKDGFQVGEGKLYRYDDPANSTYLAELNSGRAPMSLLDVQFGQDVDVSVLKKLDEEYKPPKRKLGGFHGQGNRLGSPISPDYQPPASKEVEEEVVSKKETLKTEEKEEIKGDGKVQIRLADGRRIVRSVNSTDSVSSLYAYVKSETSESSRNFSLNYSFPVKPIEDLNQTIKDAGLLNSVVVQRWS